MVKPNDRVPILRLIMLQLLINASFVEVLRLHWHWHTATHSHLVVALLRASFVMMWWSFCSVLSVYVLEQLVERMLSYHPMIQEKLCGWLFSGSRCLFFVTGDVVDVLLSSQVACQWISMLAMSLARDIQTVPLAPQILSCTFLWQAFGPSSGPACLETLCCVDDPQHCSPATSRRQGDWSLKTTPHPASTQCEILAPKTLHLSESRSHRIEYHLNCKHHQPTHKPEILQSPCVAPTTRRRLMCSPYARHLAGVRLVQ